MAQIAVVLEGRIAGEMPRHAQVFGEVADQPPAAAVAGCKTEQRRLAGRLAHDAQQRLDEGRLAGAIAAQEPKNFTPLDAQAHPLKRGYPPTTQHTFDVRFRQLARLDGRLIGHLEFLPREMSAARRTTAALKECTTRSPSAVSAGTRFAASGERAECTVAFAPG